MAFRAITTVIALLAIALFATSAEAKPTPYIFPSLSVITALDRQHPVPAQFDPDIHGRPQTVIHRLPHKRIWEICGAIDYACSWPPENDLRGATMNTTLIDENLSGRAYQIVLRHEYARLLGWHN